MLDMATAPTDEELETTRKVLTWLLDDSMENESKAIGKHGVLRAAKVYVPTTISEREGND